MKNEKRLESVWRALRIGLGLGPLLAGLDKFFNVLADWEAYLSPAAEALLPVGGPAFLRMVGVVEMIVGLLILTRWTRLGAYVAMGWLTAIAVNLAAMGTFDIAVRDLEIAIAAYALARLTEAREESVLSRSSARAPGHGAISITSGA